MAVVLLGFVAVGVALLEEEWNRGGWLRVSYMLKIPASVSALPVASR